MLSRILFFDTSPARHAEFLLTNREPADHAYTHEECYRLLHEHSPYDVVHLGEDITPFVLGMLSFDKRPFLVIVHAWEGHTEIADALWSAGINVRLAPFRPLPKPEII